MFQRVTLIVLLAAVMAAPLHAELRLETKREMRRIETATPPDPVLTMLGNLAVSQLPTGTVVTLVGEHGVRVEFVEASAGIPAGGVMLQRGGTLVVLNPSDQTYWTLPSLAAGSALLKGAVRGQSSKPTGEFTDVAGIRSERRTFTLTMDIPLPRGVTLPQGFPTTLTFEGDNWITNRYASYAAALAASTNAIMAGPLAVLTAQEGLAMRTITRSAQFGYELESIVTRVEEVVVSPQLFEIPPGYREVKRPAP